MYDLFHFYISFLQDVLENETIKLDNLFILSLLYDIVKVTLVFLIPFHDFRI